MAQLKEGSIIRKSTGDEIIATLNDIPTVTDLTKKIDKTSITSDLAGTDETKVLSQKAGSLLDKTKLEGKIIKEGQPEPTLKNNEILFIYEV